MSERTKARNSLSHDVGQLGREDSIVSGRHSSLGATKTLHRPHTSNRQLDDTAPLSETCDTSKPPTVETGRRAAGSTRSTQRPPSPSGQQPPTAPGRRRRAIWHSAGDSYVDESLFGPATGGDTPSWQPKQRSVRPFVFDCTDYKAKAASASGSTNVLSSRPPRSARTRPRSASLQGQPSFVDESLFGDQLEQSSWRAPWDKKDRRPKPLIFAAVDYREKQRRESISEGQLQRAGRGATKQRPAWR